MAKKGVNDEKEWEQLHSIRQLIDSLYEEKLQMVQKMFNLTQKFVQELDVQNAEQEKHIRAQ